MALKLWQKAIIGGGILVGIVSSASAFNYHKEADLAEQLRISYTELQQYRELCSGGSRDKWLIKNLVDAGVSPEFAKTLHEKEKLDLSRIAMYGKDGLTEHRYNRWKKHGFDISDIEDCFYEKVELEKAIEWKGCNLIDWYKYANDFSPEDISEIKQWKKADFGSYEMADYKKLEFDLDTAKKWKAAGYCTSHAESCKMNGISLELAKKWEGKYTLDQMIDAIQRDKFLQDYKKQ